jgi:hypothetical protein
MRCLLFFSDTHSGHVVLHVDCVIEERKILTRSALPWERTDGCAGSPLSKPGREYRDRGARCQAKRYEEDEKVMKISLLAIGGWVIS